MAEEGAPCERHLEVFLEVPALPRGSHPQNERHESHGRVEAVTDVRLADVGVRFEGWQDLIDSSVKASHTAA